MEVCDRGHTLILGTSTFKNAIRQKIKSVLIAIKLQLTEKSYHRKAQLKSNQNRRKNFITSAMQGQKPYFLIFYDQQSQVLCLKRLSGDLFLID